MGAQGQRGPMSRAEDAVLRCVTRNLVAMTAAAVVAVLVTQRIAVVGDAARTPAFVAITLVALLTAIVRMIAAPRSVAPTLAIVYLGTVASMMTIAATEERAVVLRGLCFTFVAFAALFVAGASVGRVTGGSSLRLALTLLVGLMLVELVLPYSDRSSKLLAAVGAVLFCAFVVYDANRFVRHCRGDSCCTAGTLALWLDFANLFGDAVRLQS